MPSRPEYDLPAGGKQALDMYVHLLSACLIDHEGNRTHDTDAGRDELSDLPWGVLVQLGTAAMRLNGMLDEKKTDT